MTDLELLNDQAKELFKAFPELEFKTIASFTLIIGWLLTAKNAQNFIVNHADVAMMGTYFAMMSFSIVQCVFLWGHHQSLRSVYNQLSQVAEANGISQSAIKIYNLNGFLPLAYAFINIIFCAAISIIVNMIGSSG